LESLEVKVMRELVIHFTIADFDIFSSEDDKLDATDEARERVHEKLLKDGINAYDFACTVKERFLEEE
jgi:hypothetical protein